MKKTSAKRSWLTAMLMAVILGPAATGVAEISTHPPETVKAEKAPLTSQRFQLQCWQYGVQIIDERDLSAVTVNSLLSGPNPNTVAFQDTVGLKGLTGQDGSFTVVPVRESTCLIKQTL